MMRTTVDLDPVVLKELKARARREGKTLGALISELTAATLKSTSGSRKNGVAWKARPMGLKVDLRDKEAVYRALEDE